MENFSRRDLIVEVTNKLFIYTDSQEWDKLQDEVFAEEVLFDMSSIGGKKMDTTSKNICEIWRQGFIGIDFINHLAGNFLVDIKQNAANVFAYATATHYKESATKGKIREFVGTYNIHLTETETGWRIDEFEYNLKNSSGNINLE
jgi:hypothetical protein